MSWRAAWRTATAWAKRPNMIQAMWAGNGVIHSEFNGSQPAAFIHQDAHAYASVLGPGQSLEQPIARGRHAWVQCARGNITVNELVLKEGDGAAASEERAVTISGAGPAGGELLFIDLA